MADSKTLNGNHEKTLDSQQIEVQKSYFRHAYEEASPSSTDVQLSAKRLPGFAASGLATPPVDARAVINMLPAIAKPLEMAELSTPTDGALIAINVKEGDYVQRGTLLAVTEDRIAAASYRVAEAAAAREASLAVAKAKQKLAEQYLERIKKTFSEKAASGLELDEARSRLDEASATLLEGHELKREAMARLELEKARLDDHRLVAPFSGTVTRIKKHLGETLTRDDVLMTLVNLSRLRAELNVPLTFIQHYPSGSTARLVATLPDEPLLEATVVHVDPMVDAATNTIRIVIEIDNSTNTLPAGFAIRLIDPNASQIQTSLTEN
jgi:RND family efflux transporter MFP subunit